jgi:hypothetical protein
VEFAEGFWVFAGTIVLYNLSDEKAQFGLFMFFARH